MMLSTLFKRRLAGTVDAARRRITVIRAHPSAPPAQRHSVRPYGTTATENSVPPRRPPPNLTRRKLTNGQKTVFLFFAVMGCGASIVPVIQYNTGLQREERDRLRALKKAENAPENEGAEFTNWSKTHSVTTSTLLSPESMEELETMVAEAHDNDQKLRVVGSACSPNGIAFSKEGMLSMALLDKILSIDKDKMEVTVEAGATVGQVVEALRPHGLTLENLASINLQQIGGFIQVGAHGTGASIPPVDEQVVRFKVVTPRLGTIVVDEGKPELLEMTKVGIGLFGVISEVTLKCVPAHRLEEKWEVLPTREVYKHHADRLRENRHVKYLWYPYVDETVVVTANKTTKPLQDFQNVPSNAAGLEPLRTLLQSLDETLNAEELAVMSMENLRDRIIAVDPSNFMNIIKLNNAEVECRRRYCGTRVAHSDATMAFECGGEQWVNEAAFHTGTLANPTGEDMECMERILRLVKQGKIPAPGPIEQRWSSSSDAVMSTAPQYPRGSLDVKTDTKQKERLLYSWVGIIMYIPVEDEERRGEIARRFAEYKKVVHREVFFRFNAREHWAKIMEPKNQQSVREIRKHIDARYPIKEFNRVRNIVDPKGIMSSAYTDKMFDWEP